jgi:hypothetical protein
MSRMNWRGCLLGTAVLCMLAGMAFAGDNASSAQGDSGDKVARLETLLNAQQMKIEALEEQLASANAQDQDAQRVEAMKQQIREVLSEQEFRESLMPSMLQAGYDKGFFIKSSDEKFLMKIGGLMQFRWTHVGTRSNNRYLTPRLERDDRTGFDFNRLRINFKGHVYDPNLTYYVEWHSDAAAGYDTVLSWAYIDYKFCEAFHVRMGKFKSASTRANTTAHENLQFMSRPMVDEVFGLGFNLGVRFWGELFEKKLTYFLDVTNSLSSGENFGGGRTITTDGNRQLDGNPALAFRAVWHALGEEGAADFASQSDVEFHESPALDLGFHYAFNDDQYDAITTRIPFPLPRQTLGEGAFGLTNTNGLQINQFGFDTAFKYMGFSATAEYILRMVDPRRAGRQPYANWWLMTRQGDTTVQHGTYLQFGYFLPIPGMEKKFEAVARVGGIWALANGRDCSLEYGAGVNYYLEGNNVKLQTDVVKIDESPTSSSYKSLANVNDDALMFRVQLQVAF